jgi:hypothetical protein
MGLDKLVLAGFWEIYFWEVCTLRNVSKMLSLYRTRLSDPVLNSGALVQIELTGKILCPAILPYEETSNAIVYRDYERHKKC